MSGAEEKNLLRARMLEKRKLLTPGRHQEASQRVCDHLHKLLAPYRHVLSYSSFGSELNTWAINEKLQKEGKLVLPRIEEDGSLSLYSISTPMEELVENKWKIAEPDPTLCQKIDVTAISCALIPGVAFDSAHHRLGYGKGFYDKLLATFSSTTPTFGIGFLEQYLYQPMEMAAHDIPLKALLLF